MKAAFELIKDLYNKVGSKVTAYIALSIIGSFTGGIGILLIFPLLSFIGLYNETAINSKLLERMKNMFSYLDKDMKLIAVLLIYIVIIGTTSFLDRYISILSAYISTEYREKLRIAYFKKMTSCQWTYFISRNKNELTNILFNDVTNIVTAVATLLYIISDMVLSGIQIGIALFISWKATILILSLGGVAFLIISPYIKKVKDIGLEQRDSYRGLTESIRNQLEGLKDIKCYGLEEEYIKAFEENSEALKEISREYVRINSKPSIIYKIIAAVVLSAYLYYSLVISKMDVAALLIIIVIFSRLWPIYPAMQYSIHQFLVCLPSFHSYREQITDFTKYEVVYDLPKTPEAYALKEEVVFKNVYFKYSQEKPYCLKNISFSLPLNKITAIVGPSGAGKTTIADMLMGLITPDRGGIYLDGVLMDRFLLEQWRSSIAYVQQDSFLFQGSIKENLLRYALEATEEELKEVLRLVSAEFVFELPQGIDTMVGDRGVMLSGGERQRLILARALLRKPKLLILDEATSALDNDNEYKVQRLMEGLKGKTTVLVIAHRLSTVKRADNILVLEDGVIVESGHYEELVSKEQGYLKRMVSIVNAG